MQLAEVLPEASVMTAPWFFCGGREEYDRIATKYAGRILGGIVYGAAAPAHDADFPLAWVGLPVLGAACHYELWISPRPVMVWRDGGIILASDGRLLLGSLSLAETAPLDTLAREASETVFTALDRARYPQLLRVWNYFARINAVGEKLERYREFNMGRHEAFVAKGRAIGNGSVPAACALGTDRGNLELLFLAGKAPGMPIENPRQTSAYHYPADFGPRSPTFSRGILVDGALLVSGTASIVGSETQHPGDVLRQLEETLKNLRLVEQGARQDGFAAPDDHGLFLNVYLRRVADYPAVHRRLQAEFGAAAQIVYLHADICRADLLIEIEAFHAPELP
jgi:hypothetical protein